jgi:hypothetical protein
MVSRKTDDFPVPPGVGDGLPPRPRCLRGTHSSGTISRPSRCSVGHQSNPHRCSDHRVRARPLSTPCPMSCVIRKRRFGGLLRRLNGRVLPRIDDLPAFRAGSGLGATGPRRARHVDSSRRSEACCRCRAIRTDLVGPMSNPWCRRIHVQISRRLAFAHAVTSNWRADTLPRTALRYQSGLRTLW